MNAIDTPPRDERAGPAASGSPRPPLPPRPLWRMRVLGGLQLQGPGPAPAPRLPIKLRQFLLHLLYARLRGPLGMAEICDALWQDSDGPAARSNLYSSVHRLRHLLGSHQVLHVEDSWVWLDAQLIEVDLDRLRVLRERLSGLHPLGADALWDMGAELLLLTRAGGLTPPGPHDRPSSGILRHALLYWRNTTRELAYPLDAAGHTELAIRLCERFTEFGGVDEGLLALWTQLLRQSGQHIASRHVDEQYGPQCRPL